MNCPSRNDNTEKHPQWNQAPSTLTADLTTRADMNGIANIRERVNAVDASRIDQGEDKCSRGAATSGPDQSPCAAQEVETEKHASTTSKDLQQPPSGRNSFAGIVSRRARRLLEILIKYSQFIGPGFLIAVAYIDPGNYATDVNGKQFWLHPGHQSLSPLPY